MEAELSLVGLEHQSVNISIVSCCAHVHGSLIVEDDCCLVESLSHLSCCIVDLELTKAVIVVEHRRIHLGLLDMGDDDIDLCGGS